MSEATGIISSVMKDTKLEWEAGKEGLLRFIQDDVVTSFSFDQTIEGFRIEIPEKLDSVIIENLKDLLRRDWGKVEVLKNSIFVSDAKS